MKKIYISPAIETNQLTFSYMICGEGSEGGSNLNGGGINPLPRKRNNEPF
jgi:hypothetical protein